MHCGCSSVAPCAGSFIVGGCKQRLCSARWPVSESVGMWHVFVRRQGGFSIWPCKIKMGCDDGRESRRHLRGSRERQHSESTATLFLIRASGFNFTHFCSFALQKYSWHSQRNETVFLLIFNRQPIGDVTEVIFHGFFFDQTDRWSACLLHFH